MSYFGSTDFLIQVAKGDVEGHSIVTLQGTNESVGTVFEDIWDIGGVMTLPTAGETWEVVSSSPNDTSAGTGARTIAVQSLTTDYIEQVQVASLSGTTAVTIPGTHFRPRLIVTPTSGSSNVNEGNITLRVAGGGATRGYISIGNGISFSSHYTVPSGKRAFSVGFSGFTSKGDDATIRAEITASTPNATTVSGGSFLVYQNSITIPQRAPFAAAEKTDYKLQAKSRSGTNAVTILQDLLIIDDGF